MNPDTQDLLRLADELMAATGPDRELDTQIALAVGYANCRQRTAESNHRLPIENQFGHGFFAPEYTASLDAAMTLAPEGQESAVMHDAWRAVSNDHALHIRFWKRDADGDYAQALARQITAAALKARAHSTKESDNG